MALGRKTGGRKKGSRNRKTIEREARVRADLVTDVVAHFARAEAGRIQFANRGELANGGGNSGGITSALSPAPLSERSGAISPSPGQAPAQDVSLADKIDVVVSSHRFSELLRELRSLFLMRWVGLEGVLTTAGAQQELGQNLLLSGLREDPAMGKDGIYQEMSGDPYEDVQFFTFLTLPGPFGVASYSGNTAIIFAFAFGVILIGHSLEWIAARLTGNVANAAVSGVSLGYLTVQMGFPWTLFIFALELVLSAGALAVFWFAARRLSVWVR